MQGHCFQMDIIHIQTKNKKVATSAAVQKSRLKKYYGDGMGLHEFFHLSDIISCLTFIYENL